MTALTETQDRIVGELKAAAAERFAFAVYVDAHDGGLTVRRDHSGAALSDDVLEEYLWNSGGNMLIRVCYIVWEHTPGEDHEWGRFATERKAQQRIAALFSPGSGGKGEYYISRLYTTRPVDPAG